MNYDPLQDPVFFNYVALWRAIVKKEGQRDALRMCGIKIYQEKTREFSSPVAKRRLKRTNLKTGEIIIFKNVEEAAKAINVTVDSIKTYVTMRMRDSKWEYLEDGNG